MKPAHVVYNRIKYDPSLAGYTWTVVYEDRFVGPVEVLFDSFNTNVRDTEAVPFHRVREFRADGEPVWDRPRRLDKITANQLAPPIGKPFVPARTPSPPPAAVVYPDHDRVPAAAAAAVAAAAAAATTGMPTAGPTAGPTAAQGVAVPPAGSAVPSVCTEGPTAFAARLLRELGHTEFIPRDESLSNARFRVLVSRLCEELGAWHAIATQRVITDSTRQFPFRLRPENAGLFVRDLHAALLVLDCPCVDALVPAAAVLNGPLLLEYLASELQAARLLAHRQAAELMPRMQPSAVQQICQLMNEGSPTGAVAAAAAHVQVLGMPEMAFSELLSAEEQRRLDDANTRLEAEYLLRRQVLIKRAIGTATRIRDTSRRLVGHAAETEDARARLQTRLQALYGSLRPHSSHHPLACYRLTASAAVSIYLGRGQVALARLQAEAVADGRHAAQPAAASTEPELEAMRAAVAVRQAQQLAARSATWLKETVVPVDTGRRGEAQRQRRGKFQKQHHRERTLAEDAEDLAEGPPSTADHSVAAAASGAGEASDASVDDLAAASAAAAAHGGRKERTLSKKEQRRALKTAKQRGSRARPQDVLRGSDDERD